MKGGKVAHQRTNESATSGFLRNHSFNMPEKWLAPNGACESEQKELKTGSKQYIFCATFIIKNLDILERRYGIQIKCLETGIQLSDFQVE